MPTFRFGDVGIREANRFPPAHYTFPINLASDPATEQRIQREIVLGHLTEPTQVIKQPSTS